MEKIKIKMCMGTACFIAGSSYMRELVKIIPEKYADKAEIQACPCLEICAINWDKPKKAPYAKVNDTIISEANTEKVLKALEEELAKQK